MTAKKQKVKKPKNYKTLEERIAIVDETISKLQEVHLIGINDQGEYYSGFPGVQELLDILKEYKKAVILSGFSGIIKVPELGRNIEYILPLRKDTEQIVRLISMS